MSNEVKAKTILNKKWAMALIEKNYKLIDVQPSIKKPGEIAFIFEATKELEEEFNILVNADRVLKNMHGLTFYDIRTLIGVLQCYDISDRDRYRIMDKLQAIDDMICDVKTSVIEDIKEEENHEAMIDIDILKKSMSGCK